MKKIILLIIFIVFLSNCNTNRDSLMKFEKDLINLNAANTLKILRTKENVSKNDIFIYEVTMMKENVITGLSITIMKSSGEMIRTQGSFSIWDKLTNSERSITFSADDKKEEQNKNTDTDLQAVFKSQEAVFANSPWRFYLKDVTVK